MKRKIKCLECGRELGSITSQHLKSCCGLTVEQYKEKYPNTETISEYLKNVRKNNCKKLNEDLQLVYCSICGKNPIERSPATHWKYICEKCRLPEIYPGKIYLPDVDLVVCQICWQAFKQIGTHVKNHNMTLPEYREKFPHAWITNKEIREKRRIRHIGDDNPTKRKDVRKKMSESQAYTSNDYINKYPWIFPKIEKIRDYLGVIEVQCKKCKKWFSPTYTQLYERIRSLSYGSDGQYFYCSDGCKDICPLYRLNPLQYLSDNIPKPFTESEYKIFKEEVLSRQFNEFGYNFCEICENTKNLHVHHEKPQKTHSIMSLDPDNGIILCRYCHLHKAHQDSCSTGNLSKLQCS